MDLSISARGHEYLQRLERFMVEQVYPAEPAYAEQVRRHGRICHDLLPAVEELKSAAREQGLWNLFLPELGGLSTLDYARLAELTGRSPYIAPEALNCSAPDTGNMELLHLFHGRTEGAVVGPAARRHDPVRLRHDRAGRRVFGRAQHPDVDPARRRRAGDTWPQVIRLLNLSTRRRWSRFAGSTFWQAYYVEYMAVQSWRWFGWRRRRRTSPWPGCGSSKFRRLSRPRWAA
jgi:hypothetical protein